MRTVLIVSPGEVFGGVERHILMLSNALPASGWNVRIVVGEEGELAAQSREFGLAVDVLGVPGASLSSQAAAFTALIDKYAPEVVHLHGYKMTCIAALVGRKRDYASVKTVHGFDSGIPRRGLARTKHRIYGLLEVASEMALRAQLCFVTQELYGRASRLRAAARSQVIGNGLRDLSLESHATPEGMRPADFNIVVVGRLEPVKGVNVAIDAMGEPTMPSRAKLHIVGSGPEEARLKQAAQQSVAAARISFYGHRRDAANFIQAADVLMMPSLHEGLPYTALEAMCLKTPLLCSDVGGLTEVLKPANAAVLVPAKNPAALAEQARFLCENDALRTTFAARARKLFESTYSDVSMARKYAAVYDKGVALRTRRRPATTPTN